MRRDLFYRLNQVRITLPPLRERTEDILPLAETFLGEAGGKNRPISIAPEAAGMLIAYRWPGNARELRNAMERIVLLEEPDCLYPHHLHFILGPQTPAEGGGMPAEGKGWGPGRGVQAGRGFRRNDAPTPGGSDGTVRGESGGS